MPASYPLPSWLVAADPAAHYQNGLQIGVRIGAEQAAQQYQQQQLLQKQQEDEYEKQYKNTLLQLKVDDAVRRQQGVSKFHELTASGVSPSDALLQVGPDMGEDLGAILRAQEASQSHAEAIQQRREAAQMRMEEITANREQRAEISAAKREEEAAKRKSVESMALDNRRMRAQMAIGKDEELKSLVSTLEGAKQELAAQTQDIGKWYGLRGPSKEKIAQLQKAVTDAQADIQRRRNQLMQEYGLNQPEAQAPDEAPDAAAPGDEGEPANFLTTDSGPAGPAPDVQQIGKYKVRVKQ